MAFAWQSPDSLMPTRDQCHRALGAVVDLTAPGFATQRDAQFGTPWDFFPPSRGIKNPQIGD